MNPEEIQRLISQNRQETGQRYAAIPGQYEQIRGELFGGDQTLRSLRGAEEEKIQELWRHDQDISRYSEPTSPTYLEDPYQRERARAIHFQGTVGELTGLQSQIAQQRDVLGDTLEKALRMLEYGSKAKEFENQSLQRELDAAIRLEQIRQEQKEKSEKKISEEKQKQQLASAIEWLLTQAGTRQEAQQDIGAMAARMPQISPELLSLLELFPQKEEPLTNVLQTLRQAQQLQGMTGGGTSEPSATMQRPPLSSFWE